MDEGCSGPSEDKSWLLAVLLIQVGQRLSPQSEVNIHVQIVLVSVKLLYILSSLFWLLLSFQWIRIKREKKNQ